MATAYTSHGHGRPTDLSQFFRLGGVVFATSNRAPDNLYENGLQRSLFIPFIDTLKRQVLVSGVLSFSLFPFFLLFIEMVR